MPLARIITQSRECAQQLALDLLFRGYAVEIVSPDAIPNNFADLELRVDAEFPQDLTALVEARDGEHVSTLNFRHHLKSALAGFPANLPSAEAATDRKEIPAAMMNPPAAEATVRAEPWIEESLFPESFNAEPSILDEVEMPADGSWEWQEATPPSVESAAILAEEVRLVGAEGAEAEIAASTAVREARWENWRRNASGWWQRVSSGAHEWWRRLGDWVTNADDAAARLFSAQGVRARRAATGVWLWVAGATVFRAVAAFAGLAVVALLLGLAAGRHNALAVSAQNQPLPNVSVQNQSAESPAPTNGEAFATNRAGATSKADTVLPAAVADVRLVPATVPAKASGAAIVPVGRREVNAPVRALPTSKTQRPAPKAATRSARRNRSHRVGRDLIAPDTVTYFSEKQ